MIKNLWARTELHGRMVITLLRIREILGSNVSPEILTEGFRSFPQFLQANAGLVSPLSHDCFLPHSLQIITHSTHQVSEM
jgi:hypothetical protein